MSQDIFEKAKRAKEKHREKVGSSLRDRVRRTSSDTLTYFARKRSSGWTDKEILKDLSKSKI